MFVEEINNTNEMDKCDICVLDYIPINLDDDDDINNLDIDLPNIILTI